MKKLLENVTLFELDELNDKLELLNSISKYVDSFRRRGNVEEIADLIKNNDKLDDKLNPHHYDLGEDRNLGILSVYGKEALDSYLKLIHGTKSDDEIIFDLGEDSITKNKTVGATNDGLINSIKDVADLFGLDVNVIINGVK